MPDFKEIQGNLQNAKKNRKQSMQSVFLSEEKLKKLEKEKENLLRSNGADSEAMQRIITEENGLKRQIAVAKGRLQVDIKAELGLLNLFKPFTDPREHIQQFSDETPFLLFPVRLETRFKKVPSDGERGIQHQLWVRIFPDECSIDTFENVLSEDEVTLAKSYWSTVWSAGKSDDEALKPFIKNKLKAAWKNLSGNFQPGRAYWITQNYLPENEADLPERTNEEEIILVIPTQELPTEDEQSALKTYWTAVWVANGDIGLNEAAFNQLITEVGSDEKAVELISNYKPINLQDTTPSVEDISPVIVGFLHFPKIINTDTQQSSWSQPARVTTFPDKFVLLGYKGTDSNGNPIQVLNELGENIPDPLIVGPNPSLDTTTVLRLALMDEYTGLIDAGLKEQKLGEYYDKFKDSVKAETSRDVFIADFLALSDDDIIAELGKVFDNFKDDVKAESYIEYLCRRSETKWLFDFEEAVKVGMGFKSNLSRSVYENGFDRLFVLGIKLSADENEAKTDLEELIQHHHYGVTGFSIMPQGTPTNNTEDEDSGYSEEEDYEETFERYMMEPGEEDPDDFFKKKDGKWLAEQLGINADNASLKLAANYYQTDQCEAKAMNTALWTATIGYWMESMMHPMFSARDEATVRDFFIRFVSGRGNIPAIRIGDQPYGILATSTVKNLQWLNAETNFPIKGLSERLDVIRGMYDLFKKVCDDWKRFSDEVAYIGKDGDPHQILLDVLGLHASSVEFYQRYAEGFAHLLNRLKLGGARFKITPEILEGFYQNRGLNLLKQLGYSPNNDDEVVEILEKSFLGKSNQLKGDLIDDQPLSEKNSIRSYTDPATPGTEGKNYIYWLIENAKNDHDKIKKQNGFTDGAPTALLYQLLRHAIELEFSNTAFRLYESADILNAHQIRQAKVEANFIGVQAEQPVFTRYDYLDRNEPKINNLDFTVAQHITNLLSNNIDVVQTNNLREIINALDHLKNVPTARLERAFVEHLDCCTYRLDAWLLGFINFQLHGMRYQIEPSEPQTAKPGIYLGAYGWLEDLKPDTEVMTPVQLNREQLDIFNPDGDLELLMDSNNGGYIHAPSINQATTAAVLRNAYISNANQQDPEVYKVNLSSERVRMALGIIEGMQHGQSIGELLGYQLERGLHDRYEEAEVDTFIYELRKAFPLNSNRMNETSEDETDLDSITQIEARNVVDGLALVNHINKTGNKNYPFGKTGLATADASQRNVIGSEVERLLNINDAIADLAAAEGVHQVVQANYERAAGALETYSKGGFPQIPEVIKTPRSGVSLTNRVGIHLESGLSAPANANPRAAVEPAIEKFLSDLLPAMSDICCKVVYTVPTYEEGVVNAEQVGTINMKELGLNASDLFYQLDVESAKSLTALDDYILKQLHESNTPRPDVELKINYTEPVVGKVTVFELAPLIKSLRALILSARPLKNSDMILSNEASSEGDVNCSIDLIRINTVFKRFKDNFSDSNNTDGGIDLFNDAFISLIDDDDFEITLSNKQQIINNIDAYAGLFLARLYSLSQFGIPHAGFGFIYDRKAGIYAAIYQKVLGYKKRWEDKQTKYGDLMTEFGNATADGEKIEILQKAERTVSTTYSIPVPTIADYVNILEHPVTGKKKAFDDKLAEINAWLGGSFIRFVDLVNELTKLRTGVGSTTGRGLEEFDLLTIETEEDERQIIVFAEDLKIQAVKLNTSLIDKATAVQELLDRHDAEVNPINKVNLLTEVGKQLFGEEFKIIPEFRLSTEHGSELKKTFDDKDQLLSHQTTDNGVDFPVDNWLYSVARVREKLGYWENVLMLSEGFNNIELDLTPLQLPYLNNDTWLGLSFPETYELESDKLLYTAHLNNFDPTKSQCGLLIDEWTEVIPTETETTGLTFQYDQPNTEPPQTMLLVTPSEFKGQWSWQNVVNTLHDTLDLAKLRAVEPVQIDGTSYAQFLPATVSAVTVYPLMTVALNYAVNNGFVVQANINENGETNN